MIWSYDHCQAIPRKCTEARGEHLPNKGSLAENWKYWSTADVTEYRADSRLAPSQWETALLCNDVSHWLGASLESALEYLTQAVPIAGDIKCMFFIEVSVMLRGLVDNLPEDWAWWFLHKGHRSRYGDSHYKDKMVIHIFIMGIPMLVRWHSYP